MWLKKILHLIAVYLSFHHVLCDEETYINFECSTVDKFNGSPRVISSNLVIESSKTFVRKVVFNNRSEFDTSEIKLMKIFTKSKSVKFMPAGIKKLFPMLTTIDIQKSGLSHLEKNDMLQFGDALVFANFRMNDLTALEGNLFDYNPNLKYIWLNDNPLKYINPSLFESFKTMKSLEYVSLAKSSCINQSSHSPAVENWNTYSCRDEDAKNETTRRISNRVEFFKVYIIESKIEREVELQVRDLKQELRKLQKEMEKMKNDMDDTLKLIM